MYIHRLVFTSSPSTDPEDEKPSSPQSSSRVELKFEEATGDEYFDLGHHREERAGNGWGTDLWTSPPDRESKLEVVKSGSLYDIRAYKGETKPSRLYNGDEEELRYRIRPEEASPEKAEELEEERREIIRSQVVRKSTTMAEKWSSTEDPSSLWESSPVNPQNIDTEKINFAMARQQFLELEKVNPKMLLGPRKPAPSSRTTQNVQGMEGQKIPDVYSQRRIGWSTERTGGQGLAEGDLGSSDETPIEREIRLSMEREDAHRKERGIHRVNSRDELVEIQTKPLLLSDDTPPVSSRKGKEKHTVSFFVQREIEQETRREEDLQKEGRLLSGTYDKGVRQELSERRKVFERDEAAPMTARMPGESEEAQNGDPGRRMAGQDVKSTSEAYQPSLASGRKQRGDLHPFDRNDTGQRVDPSGSRVPEDSGEEPAVLREGHFAIPVRKLKFSSAGDREPPTSRGKEGRLEGSAPREELYTVKTRRPRMSALIDQEIQDALQREVELQEQRRRTGTAGAPSRTSSQSSGERGRAWGRCQLVHVPWQIASTQLSFHSHNAFP
uniref:A-kinase anchor protein 2 C-terminal domain-containing protein n=1 Tax=Podarcis muralis TaxID=64176 RepID=A0A670KIZ0_PODMU